MLSKSVVDTIEEVGITSIQILHPNQACIFFVMKSLVESMIYAIKKNVKNIVQLYYEQGRHMYVCTCVLVQTSMLLLLLQ